MQDLIPNSHGGLAGTRTPLSSAKPPPVPPPPEKYYATTAICNSATSTSINGSTGNPYFDVDAISTDDYLQVQEFSRHSLVIVEKLGYGIFGELHLCETKELR